MRAERRLVVLVGAAISLAISTSPASGNQLQRALRQYQRAQRMRAELESRPSSARSIPAYRQAIFAFQQVYTLEPACRESPFALEAAAALYEELGSQFDDDRYYNAAIRAYQFLIKQYPLSAASREALFAIAEIYRSDLEQPKKARSVFESFIQHYPQTTKAVEARQRIREIDRVVAGRRKPSETLADENTAPDLPDSSAADNIPQNRPQNGEEETSTHRLVRVTGVRSWVGSGYTRIVIGLEGEVKFSARHLRNPDRLVFDLAESSISPALAGKTFPVQGGFLRQVRVAQFQPTVTRAVLDVEKIDNYSVFSLPNPFRIIIDIHGTPPITTQTTSLRQVKHTQTNSLMYATPPRRSTPSLTVRQSIGAGAGAPAASAVESPNPDDANAASSQTSGAIHGPAKVTDTTDSDAVSGAVSSSDGSLTSTRNSPPSAAPRMGTPLDRRSLAVSEGAANDNSGVTPEHSISSSAGVRRSDPAGVVSTPAAPVAGSAPPGTLTRVLGLKVGRIVIDPGHGGHDTGTIGPHGLREKDLVLDVGLRLRELIRQKLGSDVVMTRSDDTFIPLEERTAIANQNAADLFISIHANASRDEAARGIETYYLNFTSNPQALEVAARENATSEQSVHQLQSLIKKIVLTEKIRESQDFAAKVQREVYVRVQKSGGGQEDRGVKRAPFVVLIGANMPSVLAEISFLTNPHDERLLRKPEYRQRIAEALYRGVWKYSEGLGGLRLAQRTHLPAGRTGRPPILESSQERGSIAQ